MSEQLVDGTIYATRCL